MCGRVTIGDIEQWSGLKSGCAAVVYVLEHLCVEARDFGLCVFLYTMMVTVERELEGAALCSILMPLSLLGLVPFPQLPLASSKRWRVEVRGVKPVTHTQGMAILPWVQTSEQVPWM